MNYTTLEALKSFGGFESDEDDELLDAMIEAASTAIDNYCHRIFASDEETDHTFTRFNVAGLSDPFNGKILFLDDDLAEEPSAITDSPTVVRFPENETPIYALVLTDGAWNSDAVVITGHWAFSTTAPPDVEQACLRLAKWMYDMSETSDGTDVLITPEGQVLLPQGLPRDVLTLLKPYRRLRVIG